MWSEAGWPSGHAYPAFLQHTYIYARHFSWLDLFPIWSSADESGFGSPMPVLYHKLFYFVAAPFALITGSVKAANVAGIAVLLVVGAAGMHKLVRRLGGSQLAAIVAGCAIVTANYTVTNWLVRDAVAEFSAAMLIPWALLFFVESIADGAVKPWLGVAVGGVWLGHSVMGYFVALLFAAAYLCCAAIRLAPWSLLDPRRAWAALACFAVLVVPYLIPMQVVGHAYDLRRFLVPPFLPSYQFRPLSWYFWDQHWRFGRTVSGYTVQLDLAMLCLLGVGLAALVRGHHPAQDRQPPLTRMVPIALVGIFALVLQMPASARFYDVVPGAAYLQFPWRLLAVITPVLITIAVVLADRALPRDAALVGLGGAGVWMIVSCGAFVPIQDPRGSTAVNLQGLSLSGAREYEPRSSQTPAEAAVRLGSRWAEEGCSYRVDNSANDEVASLRIETTCGKAILLPLPVYASALHTVADSAHGRAALCAELADFPGLCGAVVPAGRHTISVRMPTMRAVLVYIYRRLREGSP